MSSVKHFPSAQNTIFVVVNQKILSDSHPIRAQSCVALAILRCNLLISLMLSARRAMSVENISDSNLQLRREKYVVYIFAVDLNPSCSLPPFGAARDHPCVSTLKYILCSFRVCLRTFHRPLRSKNYFTF